MAVMKEKGMQIIYCMAIETTDMQSGYRIHFFCNKYNVITEIDFIYKLVKAVNLTKNREVFFNTCKKMGQASVITMIVLLTVMTEKMSCTSNKIMLWTILLGQS